jgi:ribonuclease BN (tRNA processing enzyme)
VPAVVSARLTVLGKSPSWQDLDGACSGYLVEAAGRTLLLDCGSGVFAKLRRHGAYERVDDVVLSHFHADHVLDLVPFAYALTYGPRLRDGRPALHAPPGARAALRRLCGSWGSETLVEDAFEIREYDPAGERAVGEFALRFQPLPHYVESNAIELRADGGSRLVYSADCGPNDDLADFARGASLLLIEATLLDPDPPAVEPPGHLTAAEAGAIGRAAGVPRLLLTHFSDQVDREALRARASEAFGGPVELAAEGAVHEF